MSHRWLCSTHGHVPQGNAPGMELKWKLMDELSTILEGYFPRYGWAYERQRDDLFRTGFVGRSGYYDISVQLTHDWVFFSVNPYVKKPESGSHSCGVLRLLLVANYHMNLAKFGVDKTGDISLSVELPAEDFCYSHFSDALGAISHYAEDYLERFEESGLREGSDV
jgi:hypothetical protein